MHIILRSMTHSVDLSKTVVCGVANGCTLVVVYWTGSQDPFDTHALVVDAQHSATALICAAENGHTSTVALLLEKGASVDHVNKVKWIVLSSS